MDYKAISKAITDPENQPHQWNDQDLAEFFVSAADEIERLRGALQTLTDKCLTDFDGGRKLRRGDVEKARSALQQKESE